MQGPGFVVVPDDRDVFGLIEPTGRDEQLVVFVCRSGYGENLDAMGTVRPLGYRV